MVNKLILEFDEIFWPADKQVIGIAGDDDASKRGLLWVWFNMYPVVKRPVLIGFNDGNGAIVGESLTKQEMIDIGKFFPLRSSFFEYNFLPNISVVIFVLKPPIMINLLSYAD